MSNLFTTVNDLSYKVETLDDGTLKVTIDVDSKRFDTAIDRAFNKLSPSVSIAGFRPGQAPKNLVMAQLGAKLFEEALNSLIPEATLEVLKHADITPITQISYNVLKMAQGNNVEFTATFAGMPQIKLPDFKKIKVKKEKVEVLAKEIDDVVDKMYDDYKKKNEKEKTEKNDDWAKKLNLDVTSVDQLKDKIKTELLRQKETLAQNKFIKEILSQVSAKIELKIPKILISSELERKEKDYQSRIEGLGMKVEDFLRNQKTTMEELKKNWEKDIETNLKEEFVLVAVTKEYNITVTDEEIEKQIEAIKDEKMKAEYNNAEAKRYLKSLIQQQKTLTKIVELVS